MAQHKIRITQVFRVQRTMIVDAAGEDPFDATDNIALADSPGFDDPRWNDTWSLQSEEVAPAADTPQNASERPHAPRKS